MHRFSSGLWYRRCYSLLTQISKTSHSNLCPRPVCNSEIGYSDTSCFICPSDSSIDINGQTTIRDIKTELRRRHLISDPSVRRSYAVTSQLRPFSLNDDIQPLDIGMEDMMTLYIRPLLLGGATPRHHQSSPGKPLNLKERVHSWKENKGSTSSGTNFSARTGRFPSDHPLGRCSYIVSLL